MQDPSQLETPDSRWAVTPVDPNARPTPVLFISVTPWKCSLRAASVERSPGPRSKSRGGRLRAGAACAPMGTPDCVPPAVMGCRPDKVRGGTLQEHLSDTVQRARERVTGGYLSVITVIALLVVFDGLGVEHATVGAPGRCAGRLLGDSMAALVGVYYSGAHFCGGRRIGRSDTAWAGTRELAVRQRGRARRGDWRGWRGVGAPAVQVDSRQLQLRDSGGRRRQARGERQLAGAGRG